MEDIKQEGLTITNEGEDVTHVKYEGKATGDQHVIS